MSGRRETLTFHKSADKEYESANFFQNCKKIISVDRLDQNENMLDEAVECDTLDNLLKDENGNLLIKVDVQGMEYDCLCGAKETIAQKHPIILVEVGTYSENMFDVLLMINSLYDRYRIYIRQRNICGNSRTVAFAIPKKEG